MKHALFFVFLLLVSITSLAAVGDTLVIDGVTYVEQVDGNFVAAGSTSMTAVTANAVGATDSNVSALYLKLDSGVSLTNAEKIALASDAKDGVNIILRMAKDIWDFAVLNYTLFRISPALMLLLVVWLVIWHIVLEMLGSPTAKNGVTQGIAVLLFGLLTWGGLLSLLGIPVLQWVWGKWGLG